VAESGSDINHSPFPDVKFTHFPSPYYQSLNEVKKIKIKKVWRKFVFYFSFAMGRRALIAIMTAAGAAKATM
jgi:hypothetical protein